MKKNIARILMMLFLLLVPVCTAPVIKAEAAGLSVAQLQAKFPAGRYWNHAPGAANNPDGTTGSRCTHHSSACSYTGKCGCNSFSNAIQCMGFAYKLGYDAYGSSPRNWSKFYDINAVKPGDVIRYTTTAGNGHSVFVTGVTASKIIFADCNYGNGCMIRWGASESKSYLASHLSYIQRAPGALSGGSGSAVVTPTPNTPVTPPAPPAINPTGEVDYITGGPNIIRYGGWAFDGSDAKQAIEIHIYVGGSASTKDAELHIIKANEVRNDIGAAFPQAGANHGFSGQFITRKKGLQPVYTYAINIGGGTNTLLWAEDLEITDDPYNALAVQFTDVDRYSWYYDYMVYTFNQGYITGFNETKMAPVKEVSRAQFATILFRMDHANPTESVAGFADVKPDDWFAGPVNWAAENEIIKGFEDGSFGPVKNVTREQMVTMLYRYLIHYGYDLEADRVSLDRFKDAGRVSEFAKEAMEWAVGAGIITGKAEGTVLDPQASTYRCEAAAIIKRFEEKFQ